jgi:molecular chaperone DnaK (HSP70)
VSPVPTGQHEPPARYVVGIDLGTTNSAVAYVDTEESPWRVRTFAVPQLVAPGQVEALETLPSFHYQPAAAEFAPAAMRLPWSKEEPGYAVGFFARDQGTVVPGRLINSAKSWLCHSGVDRMADLLPWQGAADVDRLSPIEVSARYLGHMRDAWDARLPDEPMARQDIVLTLPASFDEVARELTVKAAARAGLARVVLIEEPQAAFYAWICANSEDWDGKVEPGQKILVCDVGGGTSDFTLIRVRRAEEGKVQFHRVAVGDHLILGGDNLDLALARHIEARIAAGKLEPRQWAVLVRTCRQVKETLLGEGAPEQLTVNLPRAGSRLIGGGIHVEVTRQEVHRVLLEGFFPQVPLDAKPAARRSGFQEFGLPYAPDPAVTRYLAAFLTAHRHVALEDAEPDGGHDPAGPDIVLFNGGLFLSPAIRERVLEVLRSWFGRQPIVLENDRLDLAVARGAAYYGMVRRGQGVRIAAGLARTYYVGVEGPQPLAVCLVPASTEPGQDVDLAGFAFQLLISEPVEFPLYISSTRLTDRPGEVVSVDREQMTPLPPIRTVLRTQKKSDTGSVRINLHARLTEIGTLELWCSEATGRRTWRLEFDVRSATQTDVAAHQSAAESEGFLVEAIWQPCRQAIESVFGPEGKEKPAGLVKRLSMAIDAGREEWPASLLRRIWEALMELETGRHRSETHEARWLNLLGFALRPGYGLAVDDWRVAETWRRLQGKLAHPTPSCRAEWWILWRRIAGGLAAGQQQALADPLLGPIRNLHRQLTTGRGRGGEFSIGSHEMAEVWRLLGSMEVLPVAAKIELGGMLLALLPRRKMETVRGALAWALGRIGARRLVYGPLNAVVPADAAAVWVRTLIESAAADSMLPLAVMEIARRTHDRCYDLPDKLRRKVLEWLAAQEVPPHFAELVRDGGTLDQEEQRMVFGETLPVGLRIL